MFQKIVADNREILHALDEGQNAEKLYDYLKEVGKSYYYTKMRMEHIIRFLLQY